MTYITNATTETATTATIIDDYTNCYGTLTDKLSKFTKVDSSNIYKIKQTIGSYLIDSESTQSSDSDYDMESYTSDFNCSTGELKINCNVNAFNIVFGRSGISIKDSKEMKRFDLKQKIRNNLIIHVKTRAKDILNIPENEQTAIETLREMITEAEFRKYLKHGFVLVKGKSGDVFQVFRNSWHTKVWRGGSVIEEICVRISSNMNVPPTDNVIAFKTMIETDEEDFKKIGNVYKMKKVA